MNLPIEILNIIYLYTIDLNVMELKNTNNKVKVLHNEIDGHLLYIVEINNKINRHLSHIEVLNNEIDRHLSREYHISKIHRFCDLFIIIGWFLLYQIVLIAFTGYFYDSYWRTPNTILLILVTIYLLKINSNLQCFRYFHIR